MLAAFAATGVLSAEAKLLVTVVDSKTGEVVNDLKASDFTVEDRGSPREVLAAEFTSKPVDAVLLVDASQVGEPVQGIAPGLIDQLGPKEQMSVVAFHTTPDLVQDFTSSKDLLKKAIDRLRFGNDPDVVGAVYASADTGFQNAPSSFTQRHVILLVSPGKDFGGRVSPEATIKLARKNGVSVYLISPRGYSRWIEELAKQTGGAAFNVQEITKLLKEPGALGGRIFGGVRGNYTLTMAGNLALGEKLKIEVAGKRKVSITSMPLD